MKMIYAIVRSEDATLVTMELNRKKFSVTTLSTTGGFLKKGNATLLIGTKDECVDEALEIIREKCGKRQQIVYNMPCTSGTAAAASATPVPVTVDVGGATVFIVDVERFEKI